MGKFSTGILVLPAKFHFGDIYHFITSQIITKIISRLEYDRVVMCTDDLQ